MAELRTQCQIRLTLGHFVCSIWCAFWFWLMDHLIKCRCWDLWPIRLPGALNCRIRFTYRQLCSFSLCVTESEWKWMCEINASNLEIMILLFWHSFWIPVCVYSVIHSTVCAHTHIIKTNTPWWWTKLWLHLTVLLLCTCDRWKTPACASGYKVLLFKGSLSRAEICKYSSVLADSQRRNPQDHKEWMEWNNLKKL